VCRDLFSFADELPDEYYVIAAQAPYDLQYGSYALVQSILMQTKIIFR
jgi:hypothetical protein